MSDLTTEAKKALVDEYESVLRVCRLSVAEWYALDADEQACMLLAQKRIDVERAVMAAASDPWTSALLMSEVDGGEQLAELKVRAVIDSIMAKHLGQPK